MDSTVFANTVFAHHSQARVEFLRRRSSRDYIPLAEPPNVEHAFFFMTEHVSVRGEVSEECHRSRLEERR